MSWLCNSQRKYNASAAKDGVLFLVAQRAEYPSGSRRVVVLRSRDNGDSWEDHAKSDRTFPRINNLSGSPFVTPDGSLIGAFTVPAAGQENDSQVFFFRIRV